MHAAPISTNTKKFVILGKSFYIQTKEIENPKLNDIKAINRRSFCHRNRHILSIICLIILVSVVLAIVFASLPNKEKVSEILKACSKNQCENNGYCVPIGSHYECKCNVNYFGENCQNSLLHHWILSDLNDKKGNATLENSTNTNYAANRYRKPFQATEFKKGYYQISNSIEIENNFSVSAWVKLDSDKQYNTLVSFADEKRENSIWIGFSRLNFHVEISNSLNENENDKMVSTSPLPMNFWSHVTFVLKNNMGYMYLNGTSNFNATLAAPNKARRNMNFIGKDSHNSSLFMAEAVYENLKIYKGALTSDELKEEYNKDQMAAESNKIEWEGNWAIGCNFSTYFEIVKIQVVNITECSKKCQDLYDCSHFTFEFSSSYCSLRFGYVNESSVVKAKRNYGCGLTNQLNKLFNKYAYLGFISDSDLINLEPAKNLTELKSANNTLICLSLCFIQNYKYAVLRNGDECRCGKSNISDLNFTHDGKNSNRVYQVTDFKISSCDNNQCRNEAKCIENGTDYLCQCRNSGYSGKYCENYNACWNNPCDFGDTCEPKFPNSIEYKCTCNATYLDSSCKADSLGEIILMIAGSNQTLITLDNKNKIKIWNDLSFKNSTLLKSNRSDSIKSVTLLQNEKLLAVANKEIVEIWNLTDQSKTTSLIGHEGNVNALQKFNSMNKTYLISGSQDNTIRVWDEQFVNIQTDYSSVVSTFAYNHKLQLLAGSDKNNFIKIWLPSIKDNAQKKLAHDDILSTICVLNNGLIATGSDDNKIKIWKKEENKTELQLIATLTDHLGDVNTLIVLKNNSLVSGSQDGTIKIWNQTNNTSFECLITYKQLNSIIYILLDYQSTLIFSGDSTGWIYFWNQTAPKLESKAKISQNAITSMIVLDNGSVAIGSYTLIFILKKINETFYINKTLTFQHTSFVNKFALLPNNMFASASSDFSIRIWNQNTFEVVRVLTDHKSGVFGLTILKNGHFVSISADKTAIVWESSSFRKIKTVTTNATNGFIAVSSYLDDSFITADRDRTVQIWDSNYFCLKLSESFQSDNVLSLSFFNTNYLLSGHSDGKIKVMTLNPIKVNFTLMEHKSDVTCITNINDQSFASGSSDKTIIIWDFNFKPIINLNKQSSKVNAIVYLSNNYLISSSKDNFIYIYKTRDIQLVNEFQAHSEAVYDLEILDDKSQLFATCSADKSIKIWNDSKLIANLTGHNDYVYSLVYSSFNKLLISGSRDRSIKLWKVTDNSLLATLFEHQDSVVSLMLLPNEATFASGSCDFTIIIWNLNSLKYNQTLTGHSGCVNALTVYKNKYLLSGSSDKVIFIWEINSLFKLRFRLEGHSEAITSLGALDLGAASASVDKTIKIWPLKEGELLFKEEGQVKSAHVDSVSAISVLNNGLIATGSNDNLIRIWKKEENKTELQLIATLTDHLGDVNTLIVLKNNSLVSGSSDKTIKVWIQLNDTLFKCVNTLTQQNTEIWSLVEYDSNLFISGAQYGDINFWSQTTSEMLQQIRAHTLIVTSIIVLNNGNLATASGDKTISYLKKINETLFVLNMTLIGHSSWIYALAVLPNNSFASASQDNSIRIWNQNTFEIIRNLTDHTNSVHGLAALKNGHFVSISADKTAIVWDSSSFTKLRIITTNSFYGFYSVCSYFNDSFITADTSQTVKYWSTFSLKESKTLNGFHNNSITDLAVLNNGFLSSASFDGKLIIWDNSFNSTVRGEAHSEYILASKVFTNGSLISCSSRGICKTWNTDIYFLDQYFYKEN